MASADPVLSLVGPLGLAASAGTALVVDLLGGLRTGPGRSLADIAVEGPRLDELSPGRSGVALVGAGPLSAGEAESTVYRLASRWPAVVVRPASQGWPGPTVPLRPLFPGLLAPAAEGAAVWQPVGPGVDPPGPGPVLPRLTRATAHRLLHGRLPARSRWVSAWAAVWGLPWA